ncbi:ATP-binding protein [Streptomyces sp. TRM 70351]|uniref:ATP-binding protein n=1 Tax=Streptomyces sp. TRM 70351 TaxID=3116552 RepID=UPI002E7AC07F|nr:ATP-binding protein [Streptomyces sp. TRM 70351]MEE1931109.1 ATP-binding protein [Streptomyces sp. TRM 70351]
MNAGGSNEWQATGGPSATPAPPPVPPPLPPYAPPAAPPAPRQPPAAPLTPLVAWLRTPRPEAPPGVWRHGFRPRAEEEPQDLPGRQLLGGALLALLCALSAGSLIVNGYLPFVGWVYAVLPEPWLYGGGSAFLAALVSYAVYALVLGPVVWLAGRLGRWPQVWQRHAPGPWRRGGERAAAVLAPLRAGRRALLALLAGALVWVLSFAEGGWTFWLAPLDWLTPRSWREPEQSTPYVVAYNTYYVLYTLLLLALTARAGGLRLPGRRRAAARERARGGTQPWAPVPERAPDARLDQWPELRAAGLTAAADRLTGDVHAGRATDLDYVRVERVWRQVRSRADALPAFARAAEEQGAAAFAHPSGARDLSVRTAVHDLLTGQVRIGAALEDRRNPYRHRGCPLALDPSLLATSLVAVGPPGSGKTGRVVRPAVEALCLQALAGQAAVVAVGTARAALAPDDAFDVVVRLGDPRSTHDLDPYGGTTDPDEAAALLTEALLGPEAADAAVRRAAMAALAQLLGPHQAAHRRFPALRELRDLLDGDQVAVAALREALDAAGEFGQQRELDARARNAARPDDVGALLADRIAVLLRPAFDGFFGSGGAGGQGAGRARTHGPRPFSLRALEHPVRVRVDLPERGHAEASRILARLVLAQFTAAVAARTDRSLFACLVLDDAEHTITPDAVRGLRRLRSAGAGAVLTLRTLDDVPEALRAALIGTVGCKVALSGVTTWDGEVFARAWGQDWVETEDVTRNPDFSGGTLRRGVRAVRTAFTGVRATTTSVTVRRVQRERWSASDLAHRVPPGHAVLSLTSVSGEAGPPLLTRLGG